MRHISVSMIALEHLRNPQAIVATINTLVSSFTVIKVYTDVIIEVRVYSNHLKTPKENFQSRKRESQVDHAIIVEFKI